jgi:hypothetical protein
VDDTQIKEQVRERYADIARQKLAGTRSSCCAPTSAEASCCAPSDVIPADLIATKDALPQDIVNTSLGCGTPLEIA